MHVTSLKSETFGDTTVIILVGPGYLQYHRDNLRNFNTSLSTVNARRSGEVLLLEKDLVINKPLMQAMTIFILTSISGGNPRSASKISRPARRGDL